MPTTNPWKQFQEFMPRTAKAIGTVGSVKDDGSSIIALQNGSQIRVRGRSVPAGKKAMIMNGQIVRDVPDLPRFTVQV